MSSLREQADAASVEAVTKASEAETKASEAEALSGESDLMAQVAEKLSEAADLEEGGVAVVTATKTTGKRRGRPAGKKTAKKKTGTSTKKRGSKSMKEMVCFVLKGKKKGLILPDIVMAISKAGYKTTSKNPIDVVYQAIHKLMKDENVDKSQRVVKTDEGCYRLKTAA